MSDEKNQEQSQKVRTAKDAIQEAYDLYDFWNGVDNHSAAIVGHYHGSESGEQIKLINRGDNPTIRISLSGLKKVTLVITPEHTVYGLGNQLPNWDRPLTEVEIDSLPIPKDQKQITEHRSIGSGSTLWI